MPRSLAARFTVRSLLLVVALVALAVVITACDSSSAAPATPIEPTATPAPPPPTDTPVPPSPTPVLTPTPSPIPAAERGFVPVLCYHHIRDWEKSDTEDDRAYIVPPSKLEKQLAWLQEQGYTGVTAKQVFEYYAYGKALPPKPVALTFDDGDDNQFQDAAPLLKKYGFTATFFIMTVVLDKENYMTSEQVKELDKQGFDIEAHTWDHHMVTKYTTDDDWRIQITEPKKQLEELVGHEVSLLAYPFGVYDAKSAEKIKSLGYKGAFRLNEVMDDAADPLFAIKRYIANAYWTMDQFETVIKGGWE